MAQTRVGVRLRPTIWNNLLAYYKGDGTPDDSLGNYNGTLVNGTTYGTGIINQGFSFDGVNDYVDLGNNLDFDGSTPFSFNVWINPTALQAASIISKQDGSPKYTGYRLNITANGQIQFLLIDDYSTNNRLTVQTSTSMFPYGVFSMITVTYDGSKNTSGIKIYVNGISKSFSSFNNFTGSSSNTISSKIGSFPLNSYYYFNGIIDDLSVFNKQLTSTEVTELYNSGSGKQYPN